MPNISYYPQINEMIYHGWYQTISGFEGLTYEDIEDLSEQIMYDLNSRILPKNNPTLKQVLISQTDDLVIGTPVNLLLIFTSDTILSDQKLKQFERDLKEIFKLDRAEGRKYILRDHQIIIG